jgi:MFS family permease
MEYLTENTTVENRGRIGATVFFATFLGIFALAIILDLLAYQWQMIILGAWRFAGLAIFTLLNPSEIFAGKKTPSYVNVVRERSFILYFSAWLMFSLINYLSAPILNNHFGEDFVNTSTILETLLTAIFAFPTGVFCDAVGRKKLVMLGFIMLGFGYAVLGVFPASSIGWYFYTVVDGIAWGILGVVFFMIIWGDIAYGQSSRKYFALGGLPLLFSNLLQRLIGPDLTALIPVTAVFSLASFFLFLAVIPLIYVPETLPEKKIKERQMKKYVEEAKKVAEKEIKEK